MTKYSYDLIEESHGLALWKRSDGKRCVTTIDRDKAQVTSFMHRDNPPTGGVWFARICDRGIEYVATGYSPDYAIRIYRREVAERMEREREIAAANQLPIEEYPQTVVTYQLADLPGEITLCRSCSHEYPETHKGRIGPVSHGARDGYCEICQR